MVVAAIDLPEVRLARASLPKNLADAQDAYPIINIPLLISTFTKHTATRVVEPVLHSINEEIA